MRVMISVLCLVLIGSLANAECPYCKEQSVITLDYSTKTLMGYSGNVDPNITTHHYHCSKGHTWIEKWQYGEMKEYIQLTDGISNNLTVIGVPKNVTAPAECETLKKENEYLKRENCLLRELVNVYHKLVKLLEGES